MMLKLIFRYVSVAVIMLISAFFIATQMPGNAIDYLMMRDEKAVSDMINHDEQKNLVAQRLGYNDPLFYVSLTCLAEAGWHRPQANTKAENNFKMLVHHFGCGKQLFLFAEHLNRTKFALQQAALQTNAPVIQDSFKKIIAELRYIESDGNAANMDSLLQLINYYAVKCRMTEVSTVLLQSWHEVVTHQQPLKKWIPVIEWHGDNRFHHWLFGDKNTAGVIRFDFGSSLYSGIKITTLIKEKIIWSFFLASTAIVLALLSSMAVSFMLVYLNTDWLNNTFSVITALLYALPVYIAGVLLLFFFSNPDFFYWLPSSGIKPLQGYTINSTFFDKISQSLPYVVLPLICYTYSLFAFFQRLSFSLITQELNKTYVIAARAKGLPFAKVLLKHVMPNILGPFMALLANAFPALISGSVIIESLFAIPGMGAEIVHAAITRNYPFLSAVILLAGLATMMMYLINDVVQQKLNPRKEPSLML
jgi:peptide/nickel transport system permease protein